VTGMLVRTARSVRTSRPRSQQELDSSFPQPPAFRYGNLISKIILHPKIPNAEENPASATPPLKQTHLSSIAISDGLTVGI
jgi:hypothetical protein